MPIEKLKEEIKIPAAQALEPIKPKVFLKIELSEEKSAKFPSSLREPPKPKPPKKVKEILPVI